MQDFFHQQYHIPEVRDLLLGKEPDDLDLTLCLRDCPEEVGGAEGEMDMFLGGREYLLHQLKEIWG